MDYCEDCGQHSEALEMEPIFEGVPRLLCPLCRQNQNNVAYSLLMPINQREPELEPPSQPHDHSSPSEPIKPAQHHWWERLIELWPWSGRRH